MGGPWPRQSSRVLQGNLIHRRFFSEGGKGRASVQPAEQKEFSGALHRPGQSLIPRKVRMRKFVCIGAAHTLLTALFRAHNLPALPAALTGSPVCAAACSGQVAVRESKSGRPGRREE